MSKLKKVEVSVSSDRLYGAAHFIVNAMNKAQTAGFSIDETIAAMLFMTGSAIRQRGASLDFEAPIKSLPPLIEGFNRTPPPVSIKACCSSLACTWTGDSYLAGRCPECGSRVEAR